MTTHRIKIKAMVILLIILIIIITAVETMRIELIITIHNNKNGITTKTRKE